MVKKSAVILGILAMLALGVGMSWGYTVAKWPVPGIPNAGLLWWQLLSGRPGRYHP